LSKSAYWDFELAAEDGVSFHEANTAVNGLHLVHSSGLRYRPSRQDHGNIHHHIRCTFLTILQEELSFSEHGVVPKETSKAATDNWIID
jgi:hypothetical protein